MTKRFQGVLIGYILGVVLAHFDRPAWAWLLGGAIAGTIIGLLDNKDLNP